MAKGWVYKPPPRIDPKVFLAMAERDLKPLTDEMKKLAEETVKTWEKKPEFVVTLKAATNATRITYSITTDSEVWNWVDKGTKRHRIRARRASALVFQVGGQPKTIPNKLTSVPGLPGTETVGAKEVMHPGTKPRNFTPELRKEHSRRVGDFAKRYLKDLRNQFGPGGEGWKQSRSISIQMK